MHIQYMQILVPVVNAVMAFPFGQAPNTLISEIADHLVGRARQMREHLFPGLEGENAARAELGILRAVANLYAQCHFAEMTRLMSMDEQQREGQSMSMEALWQAFDERMTMIETLASNLAPGGTTDIGAGGGDASRGPDPDEPAAAASSAPEAQSHHTGQASPAEHSQPQDSGHEQAEPAQDQDSGAQDQAQDDDKGDEGGFNPMAFFAKGSENHDN